MVKIVIANHVMLTSQRPWQREDLNFFEVALARFQQTCELAKKEKALLVLTGESFGRLTNIQLIKVLQCLPNSPHETVVVTDKSTPLLYEMNKANVITLVTPTESRKGQYGGIFLSWNKDEAYMDQAIHFMRDPSERIDDACNFLLTPAHRQINNELADQSLPESLRLYPGDDHKASVLLVAKDMNKEWSVTNIYSSFDDSNYLSKLTDQMDRIKETNAFSPDGNVSRFATLLAAQDKKRVNGDVINILASNEVLRSEDDDMEEYIKELYAQAQQAISPP